MGIKSRVLFIVSIIFLGACPLLFAQEKNPEPERDRTVFEERRDILRYGIDSEVVSLFETLQKEEYTRLNSEILDLFKASRNTDLQTAAIKTLTSFKYEQVLEAVIPLLEEFPTNEKLLTSALQSLIEFEYAERIDLVRAYVTDEKVAVALKAVEVLGVLGSADDISYLHKIYEDDTTPETVQAGVLSALGKLGDEESIPFLSDILADTTRERSFRWRACQALGSIGTPEALPPIVEALSDGDTILRTYAVRALREFDADLVFEYFIEALRDSFWRVRLAAVETLGERRESRAIEILEYKAQRDPEEKIKIAAINALAEIGGGKSYEVLRRIAVDESNSLGMRSAAIHDLAENDLASSFKTFDAIIAKEWTRENSRLLIELVKALTSVEHPRLAGYYEQFLRHRDVSIVLMGLKGIERNRFVQFQAKLQELSEARAASAVKRSAAAVLESF